MLRIMSAFGLLLLLVSQGLSQMASLTRISVSSDGQQAQWGASEEASCSADGRFIVFRSSAGNLVANDTNERDDIFVRDRLTGSTTRVSVASNGAEGNGASWSPTISGDGRFVAFDSEATNLSGLDTNIKWDAFVHDRETGQTIRISMSTTGAQGNADSGFPKISGDGRFVTIESDATNLVAGDTNRRTDIFVYSMLTNQIVRVSVTSAGVEGNGTSRNACISRDGHYVAFESDATNFVQNGIYGSVYVHDTLTHQTAIVSVTLTGQPASAKHPSLNSDGHFVAFDSSANNLVAGDTGTGRDVFVFDQTTRKASRVSVNSSGNQGDGTSEYPSLSEDGSWVAFHSFASNLVAGDANLYPDVFVHDRQTKSVTRVSRSWIGTEGNRACWFASISASGGSVVFTSYANNLVSGDTNNTGDIFVFEDGLPPRSVSGTVNLSDLSTSPSGTVVKWILFEQQSGQIVEDGTSILGGSGEYTAHVYRSVGQGYAFTVQGPHWLRGVRTNINLDSDATGVDITLTNGDCNGDNAVDLTDYTILVTASNSLLDADPLTPGNQPSPRWDAKADLNVDGAVDLSDYTILIQNFNKIGF